MGVPKSSILIGFSWIFPHKPSTIGVPPVGKPPLIPTSASVFIGMGGGDKAKEGTFRRHMMEVSIVMEVPSGNLT